MTYTFLLLITDLTLLIPIFFLIAIVYSAAGFGGGSSYLAVLALCSIDFIEIRMIALLCNITVTIGSVILFYRHGILSLKKIIPLIILSVPLAYIGGKFPIQEKAFFIILGTALFFAGLLMLLQKPPSSTKKLHPFSSGMIGGGIGFLSGIVGIGGGIFLSPILHLIKWDKPKIIAATTATFIFINSLAGLSGQLVLHGFSPPLKLLVCLLVAVFLGGLIGSKFSIQILSPRWVKKITGILILVVAIRLLYKYLIIQPL